MMHRAAEAAEDVVEVAKEVADDALALVDTDTTTLVRTLREVSGEVAKYLGPAIQHGESHWRNARDVSFWNPNSLTRTDHLPAGQPPHRGHCPRRCCHVLPCRAIPPRHCM